MDEILTSRRLAQEKTLQEIHPEKSIRLQTTRLLSLPTEIAESAGQPFQIARMLSAFWGVCRKWRKEFGNEKRWLKLHEKHSDQVGNGCTYVAIGRFSDTVDFEAYMTGEANEAQRHAFTYWTLNTEYVRVPFSQRTIIENKTGR